MTHDEEQRRWREDVQRAWRTADRADATRQALHLLQLLVTAAAFVAVVWGTIWLMQWAVR